MRPRMIVVAGPPGSGKSTGFQKRFTVFAEVPYQSQ
jgi:nucleoside-triphosphatase THEP1